MASKTNQSKATHKTVHRPDTINIKTSEPSVNKLTYLTSGWRPYLLLFIVSFLLYGNTLKHQYALDDEIVICKNDAVQKGLAGTKDIFTKDLFASYYEQNNATAQLSGGRYRPLSVFSFALEQQFIGVNEEGINPPPAPGANNNMQQEAEEDINQDGVLNYKDVYAKGFTLRHFDNILFYALTCCLLFLFLSKVVFREKALLALIVTLLFLAHPLHTEVVANVKSRDEIFSLLFMILTLFLAHRYSDSHQPKYLALTLLSFLCALLSKEYGIILFALLPLSLFLFSAKPFEWKQYAGMLTGMLLCFGAYYLLRSGVVTDAAATQDQELLNNPYLLATPAQAWATKIFVWLRYLLLCIFPYSLSSDYGYNSIAYKSFGDMEVWLGILTITGMIASGIIAFRKKHWAAFAITLYVTTLLLVTNFLFNVGATMGERLAFHASLGFCMMIGALLFQVTRNKENGKWALVLALPILLLYSLKTISRNKAWQNGDTLALTDVKTMPESALLNNNAARTYITFSELPSNKEFEKDYLAKAISYAQKATRIYPRMTTAYLNLGLAYAKTGQFDLSLSSFDNAFKIAPRQPNKNAFYNMLADVLYQKGNSLGATQQWAEGIVLFRKAIALNPDVARYWYDLGGYLYNTGDLANAGAAWKKAYSLDPKDSDIIKAQGIIR